MKSRELLFCLFSSLAVAPVALGGEAVAPDEARPKDLPVILKLSQKNRMITVKSDGGTPLYTVETERGEVLVRDRRLEELRASDPALYEFLRTAVARPEGSVLDASLSPEVGKPARPILDASSDR